MSDPICFILTGGTIDSKTKGLERDILNEKSGIPGYLGSQHLSQKFVFTTACWKDSRDISDGDRKEILSMIGKSRAKKIIISHGTFTMAETARFLKKHLSENRKIIILTGSLTPLVGFKNSDAPLNLKYAIHQAGVLSPGVYVCMNKKILLPEEAVKDERTGKFYSQSKN